MWHPHATNTSFGGACTATVDRISIDDEVTYETIEYPTEFTTEPSATSQFIGTTTSAVVPADGTDLDWSRFRYLPGDVPSSQSADGEEGDVATDATYYYYHTGTQWERIAWDTTNW